MSFLSRSVTLMITGILFAIAITACSSSKTVTVTIIATPSSTITSLTKTIPPPPSAATATVSAGTGTHSLAYTYQIDLAGVETVTVTTHQSLPVSAGHSCTNPDTNPVQAVPYGARIYHALWDDPTGTGLPFATVGDWPLGITDGAQFILETATGQDIFSPTQAVEGTATINADGSGKYEFGHWEDGANDQESGSIAWTCAA